MSTPRELLQWVLYVVAMAIVLRIGWDMIRNPWRTLDLIDAKGAPDHGKLIGLFFAIAILVSLIFTKGTVPSLGHTIALLAGAFGSRVFIVVTVRLSGPAALTAAPER